MLFIYQILISIILIFSPFVIVYRIIKNKEDKKRFIEKFGVNSKKKNNGNLIWFHGASVGEILSIIPLIKYYEKKKIIKQILITSSTLSSSKVLKQFKFKKTVHQFYPIDHFIFTSKFLNFWKPSLAIFIDSEIWPNMISKLKNKKIPLILLNARLTNKSFTRWKKIKKLTKSIFENITIAYPQNFETKDYLKKLKVNKIKYIGNLKFAQSPKENFDKLEIKKTKNFKNKKVWVASSTHEGEELFCAKTHIKLKKKIKNLITIIIPRHIDRVNDIVLEIEKLKMKVSRHSNNQENIKDVDIYIVDTFGETKKFHKMAASVFIGGSITNKGGQNPLEAARYGAKIFHGKNVNNFKDVYNFLKILKISKKINSPNQLASSITFDRNKDNGKKIKDIGEKILKKTIKEIDNLIINEHKKT